ncbi:hypothetical protein Ctob_000146 [Chrysochromulina tobinii]|uniref:Uncharacterized protein n=1 Tax=Chrysochromulina tobinii TaxID=1460289 RepID=A0A0M0J4N3_9EUKA|nr:hypothetical protein Ctob_000146 [Chrysochromulina tobinii]|eukprot:KOO21307.1 hypothetical protein Ctob_000146 [Chrysochromulina sp. CCMP291]
MAYVPAPAAALVTAPAAAAPPEATPAAEPPLPPGLPPANETGFAALQMFGGDFAELMHSLRPHSLFTITSQPLDGVVTSGLGMMSGDHTHAQVGTQYFTPFGALKAELMSNGMLQASFENFTLLYGMLQFNTKFLFSSAGQPVGGELQGIVGTPLGALVGSTNGLQSSIELISGMPLGQTETSTSMLMFGVHSWSMLGLRGGIKAALEWGHQELDGEQLHSLLASLEWEPKTEGVMTVGGTRQVTDHTRLRGKWSTTGVLALALEVAGEKSTVQLTTEVNTVSGEPKFGATINLSP